MCPVFTGKYCILCFLCLLLPSPAKSEKGQPGPSTSSNAGHWNHTNISDFHLDTGGHSKKTNSDQQIYIPSGNASVYYVRMLFDKYGQGDMFTLDSFKLLLYSLGLRPLNNDTDFLLTSDLPVTTQKRVELSPNLENSTLQSPHPTMFKDFRGEKSNLDPEKSKKLNRPRREFSPLKCLSVTDYLTAFQYSSNSSLTLQQFLGLCPALIQQLDSQACSYEHHHSHEAHFHQVLSSAAHEHFDTDHNYTDHNHTHDHHDHDHHDHDHFNHNKEPCEERNVANIPLSVWLWSSLAVIGISAVGLLGVIVIPFMQKVFYNHLLQCLVAVAIGALTGDALLHLLPHALSKDHTHQVCHNELTNHKHDKTSILKGLVGLLGIIIFFIIERVMTIFTLMRTDKRKKRKRSCSQVATISEGETDIGGKLSTHRSRNSHYQSCEDVVMMVHPNRALKDLAEDSHADLIECSHQQVHQSDEEHTTVMSPSHNHTNHDHSHFYQSHGHSHFPCLDSDGHNIPAMAWIVVIGDGIHNLCDGLAIGAAFGYSNTIGCSTAIAVLCHELPHEIGDFAVLLRAGMSLRKAIIYNIVSSVLCLVGMIVGVLLGNISSVTEWIFAAVGGMFLYIALVDMLPEISSVETREGEHPFFHLFIQCLGLLIGAGIMWLIAYYEHDLINAL